MFTLISQKRLIPPCYEVNYSFDFKMIFVVELSLHNWNISRNATDHCALFMSGGWCHWECRESQSHQYSVSCNWNMHTVTDNIGHSVCYLVFSLEFGAIVD